MKKKENRKEIAYKDNTITKENLPFPIVLYPGFYGAFFGFQKDETSPIVFCSCSKEAIVNYVKIQMLKKDSLGFNVNGNKKFFLDYGRFPRAFIDELIKRKSPQNLSVIKDFKFENNICHECRKVVPKLRYCVEMYGGVFKQNYGWYICKQAYEWGLEPPNLYVTQNLCPKEILDLIELDPRMTITSFHDLMEKGEVKKALEIKSKLEKQKRKVWNIIENEVRLKFGHKKVGEAWTSETILFYIIQFLFPNKTILRHYRPNFLQGLELDIFIKELKVGIEYQGIQHFEPVDYWGGEKALQKLKERDKKKKEICSSLGIRLVYFKYNEGLNDEIALTKLKTL